MRAPAFWQKTADQSLLVKLLAPVGRIYGRVVQKRLMQSVQHTPSLPVICVGNIVMGGSGKTPVVQAIVRMLQESGHQPAVLMRGYGGTLTQPTWIDPLTMHATECGDEALLHAQFAPVVVSRDRVAGAHLIETHKHLTHIVMDDGFQNPSLAKTKSVIVLDGKNPWGNGLVFPAGPLRETLADALTRADALIVLGEDVHHIELQYAFRLPVFAADLVPLNGDDFVGKPVLAFAGIGNPQKFFTSLRQSDAVVIEAHAFPDHHPYAEREMMALLERASGLHAIPVTTRKDWVRLPEKVKTQVQVLDVALKWRDYTAVAAFLRKKD